MLKIKNKSLEQYKKFIDIIDNLKYQGYSIKQISAYLKKKFPMFNPKTIFIKYYTKFGDVDNNSEQKLKYFEAHKINIDA